jgi:hypothetical protein
MPESAVITPPQLHHAMGHDQHSRFRRALPNPNVRHGASADSNRQHRRSPDLPRRRVQALILVEVNLLLYATDRTYHQHARANAWLDDRLNGSERVGLPWSSLVAYLRIATNPRIFPNPITMKDAWWQVEDWLSRKVVWSPAPTERHAEIFAMVLAAVGVKGELVPDAHLAALAMEHDLELCSADQDSARFPGLRWSNPLAS